MMLVSDRLQLRQLNRNDIDFIVAVTNDPQWLTYIGDRGIKTSDDADKYINVSCNSFTVQGYGLWLVETRQSDGDPRIGLCGLIKRPFLSCADLGYAFLPHGRGKGYATEAVDLVLNWAKAHLNSPSVSAICRRDNQASINVLLRSGFNYTGQFFQAGQPPHDFFLRKL